jgi:hypothetical protein
MSPREYRIVKKLDRHGDEETADDPRSVRVTELGSLNDLNDVFELVDALKEHQREECQLRLLSTAQRDKRLIVGHGQSASDDA